MAGYRSLFRMQKSRILYAREVYFVGKTAPYSLVYQKIAYILSNERVCVCVCVCACVCVCKDCLHPIKWACVCVCVCVSGHVWVWVWVWVWLCVNVPMSAAASTSICVKDACVSAQRTNEYFPSDKRSCKTLFDGQDDDSQNLDPSTLNPKP